MNKVIWLLAFATILLLPTLFSTRAFGTPSMIQPYTYSVATISGPRTLDPHRAYDTTSGAIIFNVYETLIEQDKEKVDSFIPELATEWSISPDGLTYTFKIRTCVTFSNGNPLTPSDVEYSFERAMVRDVSGGPIWMLYVPITGGYFGSRYYPGTRSTDPVIRDAARTALGHLIDDAFTSNATHLQIHLAMPQGFFMQILAQTWSSIVDKEWMTRTVTFLGGATDYFDWPGWGVTGYLNWWIFNNLAREVTAPYFGSKITPFDGKTDSVQYKMMGTGPFTFVEWIPGEGGHRTLQKRADYWGGWPAGGSGTARAGMYPIQARGYIDTYIEYQKSDWTSRKQGLLSGVYDTVYVPRSNIGDVWQQPGIRCRYPMEALSTDATFFNFNVADGIPGISPFVGTGTWGTGLPLNAFSNPNLRKAFVYSFNQTMFLAEQYLYEAFQPATPIIPGLAPFTREEMITYHINNRLDVDLMKAQYYFRLAYGGVDSRSSIPDVPVLPEDPSKIVVNGSVWNLGFTFSATYNVGSTPVQLRGDMLAYQLAAINPKFHMHNVPVEWSIFAGNYLYCPWANDRSIMPLFPIGWLADYADADNFVTPFIHSQGDFAFPTSYYNPTADMLIEEARAAIDPAVRKAKYMQVNDIYMQDLPQIMGMVGLGRRWERTWVQGWYYNPIFPGTNLYTIWKEELPAEDLDANGKVEIKDLSVAAKAYGAYYYQPKIPPYPKGPAGLYSPKWDSRPDVNQDMKVDIKDLAMIANKFGHVQPPWTPP